MMNNMSEKLVARRSANCAPKIWTDEFVQSQTTVFLGEKYLEEAAKLKESVREMLENAREPLDQLDLMDEIQRLGISYHFKDEIHKILSNMYTNTMKNNNNVIIVDDNQNNKNLYETSLQFRLLRQQGYNVPQEMFNSFMNEEGKFDMKLCGDIEAILSLYEASYLSMEGENILEMAKQFSIHQLKESLKGDKINQILCEQISHALDMPLHWRLQRIESRWFIDFFEKRGKRENNKNYYSTLLHFAKLDFNIVQAYHLDEIKHLSRWHQKINLAEKLDFVRNRIVECYLWAVGLRYEPDQSGKYLRELTTKSSDLITVIDDTCDAYATVQEVEILTNAVNRWDINAIEELPDFMKDTFLALFNFINEIVYKILNQQGTNILPYIQKVWSDLMKSYLVEAKWYYGGHTPSLDEYLENATVSVAGTIAIFQGYISTTNPIKIDHLKILCQDDPLAPIMCYPSLVTRLVDDLGTSPEEMERGDVAKTIECYMHQTGGSEEEAIKIVSEMVETTWKKMNKELLLSTDNNSNNKSNDFSIEFIKSAMNLSRTTQSFYKRSIDGYGHPEGFTKDRIKSLFFQPIPLP